MSIPIVYTWPVPDTQGFCLTQTLSGAGNLSINGNLTVNYTQPGNAITEGISRTVSLTSTNNLSGVNVTITGKYMGATVSETRAGPNNNTVYTTQLFDQVTSVSTNGAVTAMSVGTGTTGVTDWWHYNYDSIYALTGFGATVTATINYTLEATFDNIEVIPSPTIFHPSTVMTNATANQTDFSFSTFKYLRFIINSSNNTGSGRFTFIQQGIV